MRERGQRYLNLARSDSSPAALILQSLVQDFQGILVCALNELWVAAPVCFPLLSKVYY